MPSAQQFVDRATRAGYSKEEIAAFLRRASPMKNKEKQALKILEGLPETPDPEQEIIAQEATGQVGQDQEAQRTSTLLKRAAGIAVPAIAAYAAGGPTAAAISAAGSLAGGQEGQPEQPQEGAEPPPEGQQQGGQDASIIDNLSETFRKGMRTPSMRDVVTLYTTYRRRGGAHTLAQFASQFMRNVGQTEAEEQQQQAQGGVESGMAGPSNVPEQLVDFARQFVDPPDSTEEDAAAKAAFNLLQPDNPLSNLAQTFQKQSGRNLEDALFEALSSSGGSPQPMQPEQPEQPQAPQAGPAGGDLSQLSDQQLMQLMQKRGLL